MLFIVKSGTQILEIEERLERPESALDRVLQLRQRRRPNIRIFDDSGRNLSPYDLWRMAAPEARPRLPEDWLPARRGWGPASRAGEASHAP